MPRNDDSSDRSLDHDPASSDEFVARLVEVMADAAGPVDADEGHREIDEVAAHLRQLRGMPASAGPAPPAEAHGPAAAPEAPAVMPEHSEYRSTVEAPHPRPAPATGRPAAPAAPGRRRVSTPDEVIMEAARESGVRPAYVSSQTPARRGTRQAARKPRPSVGSRLTVPLLLALVGSWGYHAYAQGWITGDMLASGEWIHRPDAVASADRPSATAAAASEAQIVRETETVIACLDDASHEVAALPPTRDRAAAMLAGATMLTTNAITPIRLEPPAEISRRTVRVYPVSADGQIQFAPIERAN